MWFGSTVLNIIALLDKGTITWVLGCAVSILAAIYYVLSIREKLKKK